MKALDFLKAFEDNVPEPQQATVLKLNYPLESLLKNQDVVKWLDDLKLQINLLPEAPTMDYEDGGPDFKLSGSQQAVDSGVEAVLKALKPIPYVKVWKDDVVVLDNFSKDYKAQEDGPPAAAPAGPASSADIAGRTDGPTQPGAVMGGNVNNLGTRPLGIFGVVRYTYRKEKEPKPKKKRKKMIPKPSSRIKEDAMKSEKLMDLVAEVNAKEDPHVKVYDRGGNHADRYTISISHPEKGHKVYTMSTDSFKHKKTSMFFQSAKKVAADKTWGKELPSHKIPDEVHHEIHKLKVAEGLIEEPNDQGGKAS